MSNNPYRAPEVDAEPLEGEPILEARPVESAQSIRRKNDEAELNVRAFAVFDVLLIMWALLSALAAFDAMPKQTEERFVPLLFCGLCVLCLVGAATSAVLLFRLHSAGRALQSVLCLLLSLAVGAFNLELGVTALFAYGATCWWVLWSRGAKPVFTVHYRSAVVPRTTLNASLAEWLGRLFAVALLHIPTFIVLYELFRPEES
jgi:hypothetical protein